MGGSSGKSQTVGYRYSFDIHFALGLPLDEIIEIRASDKTAWKGNISSNGQIQINAPNLFGGDKGEGGLQGPLDVLFGEESQGVLPKLASMLGGIVPAFRGITTCFYSGLITSINPYPKPWEILRRGGNRLWGTQAPWYPAKQFIWLADNQIKAMNPAHILYLIYTGRKFRGLPRERMDEASWVAAADALYNEGLGLCLEWRKTDSFKSFRDAVLAHISAEVYVNRYTGLLSIRLLRSDYDVNTLPLFDEDSGLLEVLEEESSSVDNASVPSEVLIDYVDAITGETRQVRAVNAAVAARDGGRSAETISYPGAPTFEVASRLAVRDLRIKTSGLKRYKVTLDRRGRALTPGQPFRLRSINRGIAQIVVRAGRIEDGTLTDGRMTIVALQDVFGLDFNNFVTPPPSGWEPPSRTPEAIVTRRLIEASYRDMVQSVDPANLSLIDPTQAYIAALAVAPTSMSQSYTLMTRVGSSGAFVEGETGDWCPTALCAAVPLQATATVITLSGGFRLEDVTVGSAAMIDNEIVRVDAINLSASTVTVARGCVDTVPAAHAEGARIWFYEDASVADETAYTSGVTLQAKLLTNTSEGQLSEALAATDSLTLQGRQGKPYPPGQFKIGGAYYPASVTGEVALTWAHRDRISQSDQIIDTTMGSIGPEAGVTYSARLLRADTGAVLAGETGITGANATLGAGLDGDVIVELWAVRSSLESWQRHRHRLSLHPSVIRLIFPLTYDELDAENNLSLTRAVGAAPYITPQGFEGDGYSARYTYSPVPSSFNSGGSFALAASVTLPLSRLCSARDEIISLCADSVAATQRLGLSVVADPRGTYTGAIAVRSGGQSQIIGRPGWRYEFRSPLLSDGGHQAFPQGVLFIDADTVIFSVHLDDTESRVFKVRLSDGALLGQFTFGSVTRRHIAGFARRSNGDVWAADYDTLQLYRLDLGASFASGTAVILQIYDTSILSGVGCLEFVTAGGTEYLLLPQYSTTETESWLYVINTAQLANPSFALANRYKRFQIGRRVQGVAMRAGSLLVSRNSLWGDATSGGWIQQLNISGMITSLADGQAVYASANSAYITTQWIGPSPYVEDIAVHPVTGDVYIPTEGAYAVGDYTGYLALWSSNLQFDGVRNDYLLQYRSDGSLNISINGHEWGALSWTLTGTADALAIGGRPQATAGFSSGFIWGTVAHVALQTGVMTEADWVSLVAGNHETQTLTAYTLTLNNPGAETGDVTGWTAEVGSMGVRNASPAPFLGSYYFSGGSAVQSISRQRIDLVGQGLPLAALDAGTAWAKIRWRQSAYSDQDPGGMGIRCLTSADATLSTQYSGLAWVLGGGSATGPWYWYPRCLPMLLPTTTRKVDALYNASGRTSGTNNDHYVDDVSVVVYVP